MSSLSHERIIFYGLIYVFLSVGSLIYLRKKGASRKIQGWVLLGLTAALLGKVLRTLDSTRTIDGLLDRLFQSIGIGILPSVAVGFVLVVGMYGVLFYYRAGSLRGFALFVAALAVLFLFPYLEGGRAAAWRLLYFGWAIVVTGLVLSAAVVTYHDYQKRKNRSD